MNTIRPTKRQHRADQAHQSAATHSGLFDLDRLIDHLVALRTRFDVGTFGDDLQGRALILRHDVDLSIDAAVSLAQAMAGVGLRGTYFLRLRSLSYNLASHATQRAIQAIADAGHAIGIHWETLDPNDDGSHLGEHVAEDFARFSALLPPGIAPSTTISMHRPPHWVLGRALTPPFQSTYAAPLFKSDRAMYHSDSNGKFDWDVFEQKLDDEHWHTFQLLIHAEWWTIPARNHRDVFSQLLAEQTQSHADWLSDEIEAFGALNLTR